jgi:hypothetical protein
MLPILLFVLSLPAFGQETSPPCPTILISGPAGVTNIGDSVPFSLSVGKEMELYQPTYRWTAKTGDIVVATDKRSALVTNPDLIGKNLTVTVEVDGLPQGCPNKASETMSYDPPPRPSQIAEIKGSLARVSVSHLDRILSTVKRNPAARLYILISAGKTNSTSIKRKNLDILSKLNSRDLQSVLHNGMRITFVDSDKKDDKVVFWLVPAGADSPTP